MLGRSAFPKADFHFPWKRGTRLFISGSLFRNFAIFPSGEVTAGSPGKERGRDVDAGETRAPFAAFDGIMAPDRVASLDASRFQAGNRISKGGSPWQRPSPARLEYSFMTQ